MTTRLVLRELRKSYAAQPVLTDVDLTVEAGEIVGLLGPNGAGKTTIISLIVGLVRPDSGYVLVNGVDALQHPYLARRFIGFAPQDTAIYPVLTVRDNLSFFGKLVGLQGRVLWEVVEEVAHSSGLLHLMTRRANSLSGGERRRLHTAIALLGQPPLLLLDEPTTGSDVAMRLQLLELVRARADGGSAVVYTTHYLDEIEALAASVAILLGGRIVLRGDVQLLNDNHGKNTVELLFDGEAPAVALPGAVEVHGSKITAEIATPKEILNLLIALGDDIGRLRSFEIEKPSINSMYLALCRRYGTGSND